jgi:L-asparaginase
MNPEMLDYINLNEAKAIIFEAFGSGNFPMKGDKSLIPFMEKCKGSGCHVIITSQAAYDSVDLNQYSSGRAAKKLGALSAGDMTMESTITKTMHLLGSKLADDVFKSQFEQNISGERSQ